MSRFIQTAFALSGAKKIKGAVSARRKVRFTGSAFVGLMLCIASRLGNGANERLKEGLAGAGL
jgi:hypothetical protein